MSEYDKQAEDFLKATGSSITITLADPQTPPLWAKSGEQHGFKYDVELKSKNGVYKFPFWDSIANAEKMDALRYVSNSWLNDQAPEFFKAQRVLRDVFGKNIGPIGAKKHFDEYAEQLKPSAYSVLACLTLDYSDSFEDFCSEYGYDTDSRMAEKTYKAVIEQDRQLRRLYDREELEQLEAIA